MFGGILLTGTRLLHIWKRAMDICQFLKMHRHSCHSKLHKNANFVKQEHPIHKTAHNWSMNKREWSGSTYVQYEVLFSPKKCFRGQELSMVLIRLRKRNSGIRKTMQMNDIIRSWGDIRRGGSWSFFTFSYLSCRHQTPCATQEGQKQWKIRMAKSCFQLFTDFFLFFL